jgi:co-chaperonin GroES (HSP10)
MSKKIQATNDFVFVKRDEVPAEAGGLIIPSSGRVKPHTGEILSVGKLVQDEKIVEGKKALWHQTVGFDIQYEGETFLVLTSREIIGVV